MSKEFDPANDPNSHLSRYLAFFQTPGINPDCIREEVIKKFKNPDMNLLEADKLLEAETTERVKAAFQYNAEKMDRNSTHGALGKPTPPGLYSGKKIQNASISGMRIPGHFPNVNQLFGRLGGGLSPGDLQRMGIGSVGNELPKTDFRSYMIQQLRERQELKQQLTQTPVCVGTIGHLDHGPSHLTTAMNRVRVVGIDPGTDPLAVNVMDVDPSLLHGAAVGKSPTADQLMELYHQMRPNQEVILDSLSKLPEGKMLVTRGTGQRMDLAAAIRREEERVVCNRLEVFENDPYSAWFTYIERTGKPRISMTLREALERGCYFADTWIKPLYWAMYHRAPTIA